MAWPGDTSFTGERSCCGPVGLARRCVGGASCCWSRALPHAVGRLLFNVLAKVAEFESGLTRLRIREGMRSPRPRPAPWRAAQAQPSPGSAPGLAQGGEYMPTLTVVLPLFLAERTAAPASEVATVLVTNTLGVAFIQVRTARRVTDTAAVTARRTRAGAGRRPARDRAPRRARRRRAASHRGSEGPPAPRGG
jgi:hypothetical protein